MFVCMCVRTNPQTKALRGQHTDKGQKRLFSPVKLLLVFITHGHRNTFLFGNLGYRTLLLVLFTKMNVCVCVCVCVYIHIHTHTHTHIYKQTVFLHWFLASIFRNIQSQGKINEYITSECDLAVCIEYDAIQNSIPQIMRGTFLLLSFPQLHANTTMTM